MKNLKEVKVPGLITENVYKAVDALTEEQRAKVRAELNEVKYILTAYPQGADGERTPKGGCPCGTCYKCDEQMRDAVTAFSKLVDKYGYDVIRYYSTIDKFCSGDGEEGAFILGLLLTVHLNLPDDKAKSNAIAAGK
jgi:hypothetical protein